MELYLADWFHIQHVVSSCPDKGGYHTTSGYASQAKDHQKSLRPRSSSCVINLRHAVRPPSHVEMTCISKVFEGINSSHRCFTLMIRYILENDK